MQKNVPPSEPKKDPVAEHGRDAAGLVAYFNGREALAGVEIDDMKLRVTTGEKRAVADHGGRAANLVVNRVLPDFLAGGGVEAVERRVLRSE